jgi:predicted O-methyltransferase YrrM
LGFEDISRHRNFPIYHGEEAGLDGACPENDQKALYKYLQVVARPNMLVVEVGSWFGLSTSVIAKFVQDRDGVVYCVDHWMGSEAEDNELIRAQRVNVFQIFKNNMVMYGLWKNVRPMMMPSMDAARIFANSVADLVFIDADHREEEVTKDITAWLPKVRPGGIICGHDVGTHHGVESGVIKVLGDYDKDGNVWAKTKK